MKEAKDELRGKEVTLNSANLENVLRDKVKTKIKVKDLVASRSRRSRGFRCHCDLEVPKLVPLTIVKVGTDM